MDDIAQSPDTLVTTNTMNSKELVENVGENLDAQQTDSDGLLPQDITALEDSGQANNAEECLGDISEGTFDESSQASQPQEEDNVNIQEEFLLQESHQGADNEENLESVPEEANTEEGNDSIPTIQSDLDTSQDNIEENVKSLVDQEQVEENLDLENYENSADSNNEGLEESNTELPEEPSLENQGDANEEAHEEHLTTHQLVEDQEDFEEVDANLSSASGHDHITEDNMLGEADNTLNIEKFNETHAKTNDDDQLDEGGNEREADGNAETEEQHSLMEVDEEEEDQSTSQIDESIKEQNQDQEQDQDTSINDVEMASPPEESSTQNDSIHRDDEMEALEVSREDKETESPAAADGGKDVVDTHESEDISYNELEQIRKELNVDFSENDETANQETEEGSNEQNENEEENETQADEAQPNEEDDNDPDHDQDNDNENENEPVENVQEPEESDICLIPDDEEKEVTDAEKEQAILAREEAEKDDIEEAANTNEISAQEKDTEIAESEEQDSPKGDSRKDSRSEDISNNVDSADQHDLPDPDEPLLEEMHPSSVGDAALTKVIISWTVTSKHKCKQCNRNKLCSFRFKSLENPEIFEHLCDQTCCDSLMNGNPGKYFIRRKKFLLDELSEEQQASSAKGQKKFHCIQCKETKVCKYFFKQDDDTFHLCNDNCYNILNMEEPEKYKLKRHSIRVRNIGSTTITSIADTAPVTSKVVAPAASSVSPSSTYSTTSASSSNKMRNQAESRIVARTPAEAETAKLERAASFRRRCSECAKEVVVGDKNLLWETMDFCNEICLGKYQRQIGARCQTCRGDVPHQALGKYCVRFGFDIRQFCCASCLNEFKKGLKTCSCCQKDISSGNEGFLAPVGDKEQFKDFCSQACMRRYDAMCNPKKKLRNDFCAVCNIMKPVRTEIILDGKEHTFCSNPCFSAFKFVSNIVADPCGMCSKYFERKGNESYTIYNEHRVKVFCTRVCLNVYIIVNRRIVSCQWCKVKKYNFDMIYKKQDNQDVSMCSLNCLTLYGVSLNAFSRTSTSCDNCQKMATPQYHLTMSDASMRNFCTYQCVMQFQSQFARAPLTLDSEPAAAAGSASNISTNQHKISSSMANSRSGAPFPTGLPKRIKLKQQQQQQQTGQTQQSLAQKQASNSKVKIAPGKNTAANKKIPNMPIISAVSSLASLDADAMIGGVSVRRNAVRLRKLDSPPPALSGASAAQGNSTPGSSLPMTGRGRARKSVPDYRQRSPSPPPPVGSNSVGMSSAAPTLRGRMRKSIPDYRQDTPSPPVAAAASTSPPPPSTSRSTGAQAGGKRSTATSPSPAGAMKEGFTKVVVVPPMPPPVRNIATTCKPRTVEVGFQIQPQKVDSSTQTGKDYSNKVLIPVPVPIFVPQPMCMYSAPFPVPVPIPLPIPVPIFVPTTRNSAQGILKEIKKIQDKMPTDPLEAELLMMAELVADDKGESDSDSEDEIKPDPGVVNISYNSDHLTQQAQVEVPSNAYGDDMLQMALKMATGEYDQTTEDLESAMTTNTIQNPPPGLVPHDEALHIDVHGVQQGQISVRKRTAMVSPVSQENRSPVKRQRLMEMDQLGAQNALLRNKNQPLLTKPDANMCLKYTFGVNAWKQWVLTKNSDIEKSSVKRRLFKTELLQLTADELNYSLCLFVKEVRKPNGTEYAPDTIYYLVLGIQQYLYENGRIDNIFTDPYYERFTECLDEVARKFSVLYNDSQYIVTRVEEEHLWECKQLGAHSPHVLLSTLMFFNTKHFNLTTVEEHMQLSFSHIMKHWKRTTQNTKIQGTRNVLLRFYPPQAGLDANPRKKKVYEQQENEENPLRCPVRLYEFYLSKCPESVKTRNDVFYLQPERSCVPDSPVWYSTQALSREALEKMLHRVKMVKEINIALLTS